MSSNSSSFGSSFSNPENMNSAQSDLALAMAQADQALGNQVFQWAQGQIATDNAMTQQDVQGFLTGANIGYGLTQQQLSDYTTQIAPELSALKTQADVWSSTARQGVNEGAAEAAVQQGGTAGWQQTVQQLRAAGINVDPSDPKYAAMLAASNTATGAAAAGAGESARLATETQGQQLRAEDLQLAGQVQGQLSSAVTNDLNAMYGGYSGAQNATLANAQTSANLLDAANPFLQTAMSLRYPPVGQGFRFHEPEPQQQHVAAEAAEQQQWQQRLGLG